MCKISISIKTSCRHTTELTIQLETAITNRCLGCTPDADHAADPGTFLGMCTLLPTEVITA